TGIFSSVANFSNFEVDYLNQSRRLEWETRIFDYREYFIAQDAITGRLSRGKAAYSLTGAAGALVYPLDIYHRFSTELSALSRDIEFQSFEQNVNGEVVPPVLPRKDKFPQVSFSFVGDSAIFADWGAVQGRRYRLEANYAPDLGKKDALPNIHPGSTLTAS